MATLSQEKKENSWWNNDESQHKLKYFIPIELNYDNRRCQYNKFLVCIRHFVAAN